MTILGLLLLPTHLFCMSTGLTAEDKFLSKMYTVQESRMVLEDTGQFKAVPKSGWADLRKKHSQQVSVIRWVGVDYDMDIFWG